MPPHSRTALHARSAPSGSSGPRRIVSLIRGVLLLAIILCAGGHGGTAEEHHRLMPEAIAASAATSGGVAPHAPHGAHECASGALVRTTAPVVEQPVADADAPTVMVAGVAVLGRPLVQGAARRRRRPHSGRAALVRTSRWRI